MREKGGRFWYLLFDLDGTLTDPKLGITTSVQYALGKLGIDEPDLDKLEPFIGPPLQDSFEEFYGLDEQRIAEGVAFYRERYSTVGLFENSIYPGIDGMLAHLREAGKKLAVASSKPTAFVIPILQHFKIEQYFDAIVGSELDNSRYKKTDVVEEALRQLCQGDKSQYDKAVMIGDRKFDIHAAQFFGMTGVGVSFGYAMAGELEQAGADYIADTVQELEAYLLS